MFYKDTPSTTTWRVQVLTKEEEWQDTTVTVTVEKWMDETDIACAITEAVIRWCSRHGLNYEAWEANV